MEKSSFNEEGRRKGRSAGLMEPFRALRPAMPLQYVYLLLTVVVKEGQTVTVRREGWRAPNRHDAASAWKSGTARVIRRGA